MTAFPDNPEIALQQFNLQPLGKQIDLIRSLLSAKQYDRTLEHTSAAIDTVFGQLMLPLKDIRALTYAKQGQFDAACAEAEEMIRSAPNLATGYVRKGTTYSWYGQQTRAIEVYDQALEMCKADEKQKAILLKAKAKATEISQRKIDFVVKFPREISDCVWMLLPQESRAECLTVSHRWREVVLECKNAWKHVILSGHPTSSVIMSVSPRVHDHFEHLTIDTKDARMRSACLKYLRNNKYCSIRSLELTANATQNLEFFLTKFTLALSAARDTLTSISIDYGYHPVAATLSDLLMTCNRLTNVSFIAANPRSFPLGDFSWTDAHDALLDLEVDTVFIPGEGIKEVLRCCRRLRRLVLNGCDHSVLEVINQEAKELQILGYNTDREVPPLSSIAGSTVSGLQKIYTNDGGAAIPAASIMPLLYSNMGTLDTVFADIAPISEPEAGEFDEAYKDFILSKVSSFTFWGAKGIQSILLRAISFHSGLDTLSIVHSHDIKAVAAALKQLPPVRNLRISHVRNSRHTLRLIELFNEYARHQGTLSLESITLLQCNPVNDDILNALARITTLKQVTLTNINNITTHGLQGFLQKVAGRLTHLTLSEMLMVTDTHIGILREFEKLTTLELDLLPNLTNHAFEVPLNSALKSLKVTRCPAVSNDKIHACVRACNCMVSY